MFKNRFFRKIFHPRVEDIDQVKLVYILSLVVGLLSALAAAILKNAIHYTHQVLTEGITEGVVLLDEVRAIMFNPDLYNKILIKDLMTMPPSYIDEKENIETVMETFRKTGAWNLPVLNDGYYVGFISKSRIYTTYRELLVQFSEE